MSKGKFLSLRITDEQHALLHRATSIGPYRISLTEVVARGIELAAKELEQIAERANAGAS